MHLDNKATLSKKVYTVEVHAIGKKTVLDLIKELLLKRSKNIDY